MATLVCLKKDRFTLTSGEFGRIKSSRGFNVPSVPRAVRQGLMSGMISPKKSAYTWVCVFRDVIFFECFTQTLGVTHVKITENRIRGQTT